MVNLLGLAALGSIPLAFGLSVAGWVKDANKGYAIAGTIISGIAGALALSLLLVGLVLSACV